MTTAIAWFNLIYKENTANYLQFNLGGDICMFIEKFFQLFCTLEIFHNKYIFLIKCWGKKFLFVIPLKSAPLLVIYYYVRNYPKI